MKKSFNFKFESFEFPYLYKSWEKIESMIFRCVNVKRREKQ